MNFYPEHIPQSYMRYFAYSIEHQTKFNTMIKDK